MTKITNAAIFFLAAGVFTSVSILSGYEVLFTISLAYFSVQAFQKKTLKLPLSGWFLLAFAGVAILSTTLNLEIIPKPSKNFGRIKYFFYGLGGIFVLRVWLKEASDKAKAIISNTLFLGMVVAAGYAVYTLLGTEAGRGKGLTETMRYGYGTGMLLLPLMSAILHRNKIGNWFNWKVATLTVVIAFIGMYSTYTRGALLGFLCGLPFLLYFYKPKLGLTLGGLAVLVVLFLGLNYLYGSGTSESRFLVNKDNASDNIRRSQWQAAIIATSERPLLGWGLSNFHTQLKRIKIENDLAAKDYDDAHSHNLFLEVASGTGLIGLFFFLAWLMTWAVECFRADTLVRALIIPFGAAFVVSSQFEVTFDANNANMIFFLYSLSSAWIENVKSS